MKVFILFPHQLFQSAIDTDGTDFYLLEEPLFFTQFHFHPLKLAYHRATMKMFEAALLAKGKTVHYLEAHQPLADSQQLLQVLAGKEIKEVHVYDVVDDWLERRLVSAAKLAGITIQWHHSPQFLESKKEVLDYSGGKKRLFHADFYKKQRLKHHVLVDNAGQPMGGQWSFDEENRKRYPSGAKPPSIPKLDSSAVWDDAVHYVKKNFENPYELPLGDFRYPIDRAEALDWLEKFLLQRFHDFGPFEDAIVCGEIYLHHSVLTPMLNIGLLTPREVIDQTLQFAEQHEVPMNSLEGFMRQVLGWREYIRMVYEWKGRLERTRNYWGFKRKIPRDYWMGTTGIEPVDDTIRKVRETGYCHHIERLMIVGNFMLLNEFDPDEVYRWFMELFIDAYDWVMVPNVYGMSQFADGGLMATKPYISGSNYVLKMSNHKKGPWQETWDLLFWRFIDHHRSFFQGNPRLNMMVRTLDKMSDEKRQRIRDFSIQAG
jgi:deoxyribodipyrimidine photolyase-related protein